MYVYYIECMVLAPVWNKKHAISRALIPDEPKLGKVLSLVLSWQYQVVSRGLKSTQNQPRIIHHTTGSQCKTSPRAFNTQNQPWVIHQTTRSKYKTSPRAFISCTMHHSCQQYLNTSGETVPLNRRLSDLWGKCLLILSISGTYHDVRRINYSLIRARKKITVCRKSSLWLFLH